MLHLSSKLVIDRYLKKINELKLPHATAYTDRMLKFFCPPPNCTPSAVFLVNWLRADDAIVFAVY